ncbi:Origin recognition complex, subunit 1 [Knufia obscura]|uniref:Origin recognition complex subunit 1 n=2 Tax=Knufia TaxID=430999 RepID=A0AAN8I2V0_9EURO|nr:Origin recognition complex, subunit 1 [Knufia obscura]KAK5951977.1 Origin recognition complex, subunit 1 [Knufia fluminis]
MSRSKKWSTKGGLAREDSDDELGYEDLPWEWIYAEGTSQALHDGDTPSRKRKASAMLGGDSKKAIAGARMGSFTVKIGDAVLLKSPEQGKDWAGLICGFSDTDEDDEEEMCAHIQWFCAPDELLSATGRKSRSMPEFLPNETYITADFNMNPLTAINGRAIVMSKADFLNTYPEGEMPKSKTAAAKFAKTIMCRRAVKQRNMAFSEEINWDDVYKGADSLLDLLDWVQEQTKRKQKSKADDSEYSQKKDVEEEAVPTTPKKRKKTTSAIATPKSTTKSTKFVTPTNKRIMIKKPLEITPLGTRVLSPSQITSTPYAHARTTLHVSAVPMSLPCRSTEFETVYSYLHSAITDGSGTCIYISGTPGTGKTATVREVVSSLHQAVLQDELDGFNFVEINGMKVTDPYQSYSLLWEALKGDRVSPNHALSLLEHEFSHPNPRRVPCVVLMDELDQLVTRNQSVMYNFFNWPALRHSRLIVLAVANTMDLPERTLSNKISSRLGLTRITFSGYTHTQLMEIISSRLQGVPGNIVDPDAVQFASRKVAAVSGDARRALDICRRAVEIAEKQAEEQGKQQEEGDGTDTDLTVDTPSRSGRKKQRGPPKGEAAETTGKVVLPRVTIATVKAAINESTSSPVSQCLRALPLASKLFLAALLARSRRTGVSESTLGEVFTESKRIADVADNSAIHDFLVIDQKSPRLLAMGAAAMELVDAGIIVMDARSRGERAGKVRLKIADDEVKSSLINDVEVKGMGFEA